MGGHINLASFLEVTVEADSALDFSKLEVDKHAGVLLDGVADAKLLLANREVLQGRPKECTGGRSSTMIYSYVYTLARRAVVVTMDLSASNLHMLQTDHWLSSQENVLQLWLGWPAWMQAAATRTQPLLTARQRMFDWTVAALAAYLEQEDAEGVARIVRSNSVNGADVLEFTEATCAESLRCTPFVARKLLLLRDKYLAQ